MDETAWRVQLISLNSESNAEAAWTRLQQTNPDLLNNLSVQIQPAELPKGTFYRVQVGPLVEREAADSLCEALKSRNQDCLIIAP
ncbi:MAG: SPOR domain-containing protein, partial [Silicimonas sp.]|nr:SPOR domain-containing protein [Silicimonas sp.]